MTEWIVKKIICSKLNKLLKMYEGNIAPFKEKLGNWIARIERILAFLKRMLSRLSDNELTEDEVKETIAEIQNVVREW